MLWGPPGSGKTSIARLYAKSFNLEFITLSAVFSSITDIKKILAEHSSQPLFNKGFVMFIDEIHRFNKAQQDAFLPFMENGSLILVGATTENPSFSLNNALLSRLRVLILNSLTYEPTRRILNLYESSFEPLPLSDEARDYLISISGGDGRYLLNMVENLQNIPKTDSIIDLNKIKKELQKKSALFDKHNDHHYNLISALHKSVRGSDPNAALYWFSRTLEGGEDPLFIARRLIRMASEDIGLADPEALKITIAARDAFQMPGSPEGHLALAEAVVYLALAKSNALYAAFAEARTSAKNTSHLNPPATILNAPTQLIKNLGYAKGYKYDHNCPHSFSGQSYFPDDPERESYYFPKPVGFEREMAKRNDYFSKFREKSE